MFTEVVARGVRIFEAVAVVVLLVGLVWSAWHAARIWRRKRDPRQAVQALRGGFGSVLLLALEILIAADLVKTVVVTTTLQTVGTLGLIVLIRTFLSFSLEIEIEGVPPWRRRSLDKSNQRVRTGEAELGESGGPVSRFLNRSD